MDVCIGGKGCCQGNCRSGARCLPKPGGELSLPVRRDRHVVRVGKQDQRRCGGLQAGEIPHVRLRFAGQPVADSGQPVAVGRGQAAWAPQIPPVDSGSRDIAIVKPLIRTRNDGAELEQMASDDGGHPAGRNPAPGYPKEDRGASCEVEASQARPGRLARASFFQQ